MLTAALYSCCCSLYESHDADVDLSSLVTLARYCDKLLVEVEEFLRTKHATRVGVLSVDPFFVLTWQNVLECVTILIQCLSELGRTLLVVRSVEVFTK